VKVPETDEAEARSTSKSQSRAGMEHFMQHILIVDDHQDVIDLVRYNLTKAGFAVSECYDGLEALRAAQTNRPDLIILDLMLPEMDGVDVFKNLKSEKETQDIPVIMLTARGAEDERIQGLELGADDYLGKPFSPKELVLRCKSILRRLENTHRSDQLQFENFLLDKNAMAFYVGNSKVDLTPIEFKLLSLLLERRGKTLSREELLEKVWGYSSTAYTRTVDTHIKRLRDKLGEASNRIETTRGEGYRFAVA
jgi:two-component system phosphate regulon response regulator PhoB